ncbi:PLD nuclease N-terminal domain-containing protein [Ekhidna sp.]
MNIWVFVGVFAVAVAVYAMINILLARFSTNKKMLWFAIVVLVPVLGPLVYLFNRKNIGTSSEEV